MQGVYDSFNSGGICAGKNCGEFIASNPRQEISFSDAGAKAVRDFLQIEVPDQVPESIVDLLEAVKIDIQNCKGVASFAGFSQNPAQGRLKTQSIWQSCQGVMICLMSQLLLRIFTFNRYGSQSSGNCQSPL